MSKFPATTLNVAEVTPGKTAAAIKAASAKITKDLVAMPVSELNVYPGLNVRVTGKAYQERVAALAESIKADGFMATKPLTVFTLLESFTDEATGKVSTSETIYLADGHTRFDAIQKVIAEGGTVESVPVIFLPDGTTPETVTGDLIRNNSGEPLSPWEQSVVAARLIGFGRTEEEVASKLGRTVRYIKDLLVLASAPTEIRNAVLKGEIAAAVAVREIRASGGAKAAKKIATAVERATKDGKSKVTPSALKGEKKKTGTKNNSKPKAEDTGEGDESGDKTGAPDDLAFWMAAVDYATQFGKPVEGMKWLKAFRANDKVAVSELEAWMGQPDGSFFDASLRTAEEKDDDMSDL